MLARLVSNSILHPSSNGGLVNTDGKKHWRRNWANLNCVERYVWVFFFVVFAFSLFNPFPNDVLFSLCSGFAWSFQHYQANSLSVLVVLLLDIRFCWTVPCFIRNRIIYTWCFRTEIQMHYSIRVLFEIENWIPVILRQMTTAQRRLHAVFTKWNSIVCTYQKRIWVGRKWKRCKFSCIFASSARLVGVNCWCEFRHSMSWLGEFTHF